MYRNEFNSKIMWHSLKIKCTLNDLMNGERTVKLQCKGVGVGGSTSATNRNGGGGIRSIYDFGERRKWFDLCRDRILNKQTQKYTFKTKQP